MAGKAVPMGKTRKLEDPWLVVENGDGWTFKVLKAYTADPNQPYARWLCAVSSPYTFGGYDMGDTYVKDVEGKITYRDPSIPDSAIPARLRAVVASYPGLTIVNVRDLS